MANQKMLDGLSANSASIIGGYCPKVVHGLDDPFPGCPLEEACEKGCGVEHDLQDARSGMWLRSAIYPTRYRTTEGKTVYLHYVSDITLTKRAEEANRRAVQVQAALGELLRVTLTQATLEEQLEQILVQMTSIPWLALETKGAIFLVERDPNCLVMKAQGGLAPALLPLCATVPFGRCLCGRAAATGETIFANCVDERHETTYEGITSHGHYCVPILVSGKVLGVLNLYLRPGHLRDASEEAFLRAVADVLAGIIEHRRLEEQYLHAQKMEAVGRLASGVAHDFNNLLTVIQGYTQFVADELPLGTPARGELDEVLKATERATAISRQLLAFSHRQPPEPQIVNLNAILQDTTKMLTRIIGESIRLELKLADGLGNVKADPGQIAQIVTNLAVNARDAMPRGGTIVLETEDSSQRASGDPEQPAAYVLLTFSDSGTGMTPEVKAHLFEPFFTTKGIGRGTGLGLATVHSIVQQHGGVIEVESELDKGTTFRIYLPRLERKDVAPASAAEEALPRGNQTVLVVEDEPEVRGLIVQMLRSLGYTVLVAPGATAALAQCQSKGRSIDLVLTDVIMPEMNGPALVQKLQLMGLRPAVLYVSGYAPDALASGGLEAVAHLLRKPFTRQSLAQHVRQALDRS
jgi:signal transduction histidine kinase/ActR/RegA family two-component response regulator